MKLSDEIPFSGEWRAETARYLCQTRHKTPAGMICVECVECVEILSEIMDIAALLGILDENDAKITSQELLARTVPVFEHLTNITRQLADDVEAANSAVES